MSDALRATEACWSCNTPVQWDRICRFVALRENNKEYHLCASCAAIVNGARNSAKEG